MLALSVAFLLPAAVVIGIIIGSFLTRDINKFTVRSALTGIVAFIPMQTVQTAELRDAQINVNFPGLEFQSDRLSVIVGGSDLALYLPYIILPLTGLALAALLCNYFKGQRQA